MGIVEHLSSPAVKQGIPYGHYRGRIDVDAAVAYAFATNDPNEACRTGRSVPPVFLCSYVQPSLRDFWGDFPPAAVTGATGSVHGGHQAIFHARPEPGMAIEWTGELHSIEQSPAGAIVTQRFLMRDDTGRLLVEHFWSNMQVGGKATRPIGPPPPDHTMSPATRQRPIATETITIDRDQGFRFAGASGDRVPHSVDDEAARAEGFPGKIMQGLGTFAVCLAQVVKVVADGNPDHLRRIAARFSAPVRPCQQLVIGVFDAGRTERGDRAVAFEAMADGRAVLKHGLIELEDE